MNPEKQSTLFAHQWSTLVAKIGALPIAIFGALFLTDYTFEQYSQNAMDQIMIECTAEYQVNNDKATHYKQSEEYNPDKNIENYVAYFEGEVKTRNKADFVEIIKLSITENDEDGNRILGDFGNPERIQLWPE
ncbi:MAG TPA: hypothetical protein VK658_16595 [Chryseolinea sp.]|nr:hypothetical protein [Chryseolinea sp.]